MGDKVSIRVASKNGRSIASILTLRYKQVLVYKYGCSDQRFNNLGGTQMLFWKAIQEAKNDGLRELDMGRSDGDNLGLIAFKDRWGGARSTSVYLRYPSEHSQSTWRTRHLDVAKHVFPYIPDGWLAAAGRVLYKHMG
jgi:lipid II:glycine glycyltransferase (peptidoglycan interpeptide bridge formation enzyme)